MYTKKSLLLLFAPIYLSGERLAREIFGLCDIAQNTIYKVMKYVQSPSWKLLGTEFYLLKSGKAHVFTRLYSKDLFGFVCFDQLFLSQGHDLLSALQCLRVSVS